MTGTISAAISTIWAVSSSAEAALLFRLWQGNLLRRYSFLGVWLALDLFQTLLYFVLLGDPVRYRQAYIPVQAAIVFSQILAARQVFSLHLHHYRGIGSVGRKILLSFIVGSVAVALLILRVEHDKALGSVSSVFYVAQQMADAALAVFWLAAIGFFAFFRIPTRRNVLVIEWGMFVLFATQALTYVVVIYRLAYPKSPALHAASIAFPLFNILCLATCAALLSSRGQTIEALPPRTPEQVLETERLNGELMRFLADFSLSASRGLE